MMCSDDDGRKVICQLWKPKVHAKSNKVPFNDFQRVFTEILKPDFTKVKKIHPWTQEEDKILLSLARKFKCRKWKKVAEGLRGRTSIQCSARYKRIRPGLTKGHWDEEEDKQVLSLVEQYGKNWSLIAKNIPSRTSKQIRDRYLNTLDKSLNKEKFTKEEDDKIVTLSLKLGTQWSRIAKQFPNRTSDMIKNRFYSSLKKNVQLRWAPIKRISMKKKVFRLKPAAASRKDTDNETKDMKETQVTKEPTVTNINISNINVTLPPVPATPILIFYPMEIKNEQDLEAYQDKMREIEKEMDFWLNNYISFAKQYEALNEFASKV